MHSNPPPLKPSTRRHFLRRAAQGLGALTLLGGTPRGWVGGVYASDAPETARIKFGIIALTDCSPIVIAHEKGLFKKYGIESVVSKGANWAAIRDSLSSGDNQATHMLLGMPLASSMGLLGSPKKPMVIPWLLNRNGQSITLKAEWKGKVAADPKALKPATLPYMFTGFRLSLGIAWLVIVAAEMLTGRPGVGGFLWQEYNSLIYEHIILCILTIGLVGFVLDRMMSLVERRFKTA